MLSSNFNPNQEVHYKVHETKSKIEYEIFQKDANNRYIRVGGASLPILKKKSPTTSKIVTPSKKVRNVELTDDTKNILEACGIREAKPRGEVKGQMHNVTWNIHEEPGKGMQMKIYGKLENTEKQTLYTFDVVKPGKKLKKGFTSVKAGGYTVKIEVKDKRHLETLGVIKDGRFIGKSLPVMAPKAEQISLLKEFKLEEYIEKNWFGGTEKKLFRTKNKKIKCIDPDRIEELKKREFLQAITGKWILVQDNSGKQWFIQKKDWNENNAPRAKEVLPQGPLPPPSRWNPKHPLAKYPRSNLPVQNWVGGQHRIIIINEDHILARKPEQKEEKELKENWTLCIDDSRPSAGRFYMQRNDKQFVKFNQDYIHPAPPREPPPGRQ